MRYDVIVIGNGPAGLSAAVTLSIRNKTVLVFGSEGGSPKVSKAHEINNYLGLPAVSGEELAQRFLMHAEQMQVQIVERTIVAVYAMGEYFALTDSENEMYEASCVILATGVSFGKAYPGEEQFLGRGVSYCATCDAPLYRGKRVAVIGASPKEEAEAEFLAEVAEEVIYVPLYEGVQLKNGKITLEEGKPLEIKGAMKAHTLVLESGEIKVDGIFILRDSVPLGALVPGLQMDGNHAAVNRKLETNLPGLFACGDITGTPYQYIKAAGEGNAAALSAVEYLSRIHAERK